MAFDHRLHHSAARELDEWIQQHNITGDVLCVEQFTAYYNKGIYYIEGPPPPQPTYRWGSYENDFSPLYLMEMISPNDARFYSCDEQGRPCGLLVAENIGDTKALLVRRGLCSP